MLPTLFKTQATYSEENEYSSQICVPIPTKSLCFIPISQESLINNDREILLEQYKKQHSEYLLTSRSEIMIRRIVELSSVPREFKYFPLIKLLQEITCEIMLSEIELTAFCIYLNRFVWPESAKNLLPMLYISALAVKNYFNTELEKIATYLSCKIPNFLGFFNSWMLKNESLAWISPFELNKVFSILTDFPYKVVPIEYNFYVDAVLEMAPASVYEKPVWQDWVNLPISDMDSFKDIPVLLSLDTVFMNISDFNELPRLGQTCSMNSELNFDI